MTVCVAAIWPFQPYEIITVSDTKLTLAGTSVEAAVKVERIAYRWYAMYAGDDISAVKPILQRFRSNTPWTVVHGPTPIDVPLDTVRNEFCKAYRDELTRVASETVLSTYGVSVDEFRTEEWRKRIGDREFARKNKEIEAVALAPNSQGGSLRFLLCGFDLLGQPHLFAVDHPGTAHPISLNFWSIGSGSFTAFDWLANSAGPMQKEEYYYRVCEAKFLSERAEGIGDQTSVTIISYDSPDQTMDFRDTKALRDEWKKAKYPIPQPALETLKRGLATTDTVQNQIAKVNERLRKSDAT